MSDLAAKIHSKTAYFIKRSKLRWRLYIFILPAFLYFAIFRYGPLYGVQLAFKDYNYGLGIWKSSWVGLKYFQRFFDSYYFGVVIKNTLLINLYQIILFPLPVIFALSLNEIGSLRYKKLVQTVAYIPHFIPAVIIVGMLLIFLDYNNGIVNYFIQALGGSPQRFMGEPKYFYGIYIASGEWQHLGWSSIIYIAALSGVNTELYDSAQIDGASRFQRVIHINLPAILPTVLTLFILRMGSAMSIGFEKIFLMQNNLNKSQSEVIQTYVYKVGLLQSQISFSIAIGLFNNVVELILLLMANFASKRMFEVDLF